MSNPNLAVNIKLRLFGDSRRSHGLATTRKNLCSSVQNGGMRIADEKTKSR